MAIDIKDTTQLKGFFDIRLESIGGLGANLAGKMLAEAGALGMGLNASQFSSYGSEKKGSPVTTFVRFASSTTTIRTTEPLVHPDVIAVFHEALLREGDCLAGLKPGGMLIVNTDRSPAEVWQQTGISKVTIVCVDAQQIAIDEKTRANTAMLGALSRAVGFLDPEAIRNGIAETFGRKYSHLVDSNIRTFDRGHDQVTEAFFADAPSELAKHRVASKARGTHAIGGVIVEAGSSVYKDLSGSRQGFIPSLKLESCIHCAACDQVCPDLCFVFEQRQDARGRDNQFLLGIDYQYCKGCQKCVEACPTDALATIRETSDYVEEHTVKHVW